MPKLTSAAVFFATGILIAVTACRQTPEQAPTPASSSTEIKGESRAPRSIAALYPSLGYVGKPFQQQPNGNSAIAVTGEGFTPKDVIFWDRQPLKTTYGNPTWLTAEVPPSLLQKPGTVSISVKASDDSRSRELRLPFDLR